MFEEHAVVLTVEISRQDAPQSQCWKHKDITFSPNMADDGVGNHGDWFGHHHLFRRGKKKRFRCTAHDLPSCLLLKSSQRGKSNNARDLGTVCAEAFLLFWFSTNCAVDDFLSEVQGKHTFVCDCSLLFF